MNREDVAWAAGIIEGEGYIGSVRGRELRFAVGMTDQDIVLRLRAVFGDLGPIFEKVLPSGKTLYTWKPGTRVAYYVLCAVWPWLGERRRNKFREAAVGWCMRSEYGPRGPYKRRST